MDLLTDLNHKQQQAVTAGLGQILVLAGPGSGKTRVLTHRIAYLIQQIGVRPYQILAVTFTNKAAREMQLRLENMIGEMLEGIWLGTFHANCARILRREANYLPFNSNFVIIDADDQLALVRNIIKELNLDDKQYRPVSVHASISNAKNSLVLPDTYPIGNYRDEIISRIYSRYQKSLIENNALDFDDLLLWTIRLLQDNPSVLDQYSRRFSHILVDEFQDTNLVQYQMLNLLASYHCNLFAVGDEDQSIYRWRGADYRNILRFEEDFPQCQKFLLEDNYRSTQVVLDAATAVINRNPNRTHKILASTRGIAGEKITLYEAVDDQAEADYVLDTIQQLTRTQKALGKDFAIMYRTNAQSRLLEEAFLQYKLPYRLVGAQRFYGRREIKDIIAYLRLILNPSDELSLWRVINVPTRKIGDKKIQELKEAAQRCKCTPGDILINLGQYSNESPYWKEFSGRSASQLVEFASLLFSLSTQKDNLTLPSLFDRLLSDINYQNFLEANEKEAGDGADRWENVQELRKMAYEYQERGLTVFLENLALVSDQDTVPDQIDAPTLLTLHAAKGLEFSQVFIIGLDEGLLPHNRSLNDPEEIAEERRLLYVGMTRAKDGLYLVRADRRSGYGSYDSTIRSRFLNDIPLSLIKSRDIRHVNIRRGIPERVTGLRWSDNTSAKSNNRIIPVRQVSVRQPIYDPGMRVKHDLWGEGIVVNSAIIDNDEIVDIAFESVGFKRLDASIAKLQAINSDKLQ